MKLTTNWNLDKLGKYESKVEFDKALQEIEQAAEKFASKWKERKDYLEDPAVLAEALAEYEDWAANYSLSGDIGYRYGMAQALDQNNPELRAANTLIDENSQKALDHIRFFELSLSRIPVDQQPKFLDFESLDNWKHFLENIFAAAKHILSDPEERIMAMKSNSASEKWKEMIKGMLAARSAKVQMPDGKSQSKSFSALIELTSNKHKPTRDSAAAGLNKILAEHRLATENEINALLEDKKVDDKLRNYERPDSARHLADDIKSSTVDSLIEAVSDKFELGHRFYKLKAKLLGVEKLAYHERNIQIGEDAKGLEYEKAIDLVLETVKSADPEWHKIAEKLFTEGHVDAFPKEGKGAGAFCSHNLITQPTYILLNYTTEKMDSALTIAHELGHAINNELIKEKQTALNFGTPLSTAEVASTFVEELALKSLSQNLDPKQRLALNMQTLNDRVSSVLRQVAIYKFETELHESYREKGYLSIDDIGQLFLKHMSAYMGDYVEQNPGAENWWIFISHIRSYFYVYSYANGLLIAQAMLNKFEQDPKFITQINKFLSAGLSASPESLFREMGIDISEKSFWEAGLKQIETLLEQTEELAEAVHRTQ